MNREPREDASREGDPCPTCEKSGHTGVWNERMERFIVCPTCGDRGVLDAKGIEILRAITREADTKGNE